MSSQGYGFSSGHVWMWELDCEESWAPKNWCFWTVVLEKTLESPLDCKEIQRVHSKGDQSWVLLEGMILKLKLQYFGHLIQRTDSLEKTLMLGGIGGRRRRGRQRMRWLMASLTWWTWVWVNSGNWWWTERPGVLQFMGSQRVRHDWATELNWTDIMYMNLKPQTKNLKEINTEKSWGIKYHVNYTSMKKKKKKHMKYWHMLQHRWILKTLC